MRISDWSSDVCSSDLLAQRVECGLTRGFVAARLGLVDPRDLRLADLRIIDLERFEQVLVLSAIFVHPDDDIVAAVDARLTGCGRRLDHRLGPARGGGLRDRKSTRLNPSH